MNYQRVHLQEWTRFPKLPDFGIGNKVVKASGRVIPFAYSRILDKFIKSKIKSSLYFEFHSTELLKLYPELIPRSIVHIHGSEVREINAAGQIIETTSEFTKHALSNAPLIFYSTPELIEVIKQYTSNAVWVPHITNIYPHRWVKHSKRNHHRFNAIFPSHFDTWKGAEKVLSLVSGAKTLQPHISIGGINAGSHRSKAHEIGFKLENIKTREKYQDFLREADVAIGQGFGVIAAADIESIQLGLRAFPINTNSYSQEAYGIEVEDLPKEENLVMDFLFHINNSEHAYRQYTEAVLEKHHPDHVISLISKAYKSHLK